MTSSQVSGATVAPVSSPTEQLNKLVGKRVRVDHYYGSVSGKLTQYNDVYGICLFNNRARKSADTVICTVTFLVQNVSSIDTATEDKLATIHLK